MRLIGLPGAGSSASRWRPAADCGELGRTKAPCPDWVADITEMPDLSSWQAGMRFIIRRERPHPGAQPRFTGIDGHRFTAFAADAEKGQLADLERGRGCMTGH